MAKLRTIQLYRGTTAQNDAYTGSAGELTMDTTTNELRIHDGSTVGGKTVSAPVGMIAPFGGSTPPAGWLKCDGSAILRTLYADLFAVIGTTYGDGDGSTTFNLPEKYAYNGAVVGNGKTLGLTDGTKTGGLYGWNAGSYNALNAHVSDYGTNVGTTTSGSSGLNGGKTIGVTSDPDKSGIIAERDSDLLVCIKY